MKKTLLVIGAVVFLAAAVIVLWQPDAILTAAARNLLRREGGKIPYEVTFSRVSGNLFRAITLHDVHVRPENQRHIIADIPIVQMELNWRALRHKRLELDHFLIRDGRASVFTHVNAEARVTPDEIQIQKSQLALGDGVLHAQGYVDLTPAFAAGLQFQAQRFPLEKAAAAFASVRGELPMVYSGKGFYTQSDRGRRIHLNGRLNAAPVVLDAKLNAHGAGALSFTSHGQGYQLAIMGPVNLRARSFDQQFHLDATNVGELAPLVPSLKNASGRLQAQGRFIKTRRNWSFSGSARGDALVWQKRSLGHIDANGNGTSAGWRASASLQNLRLDTTEESAFDTSKANIHLEGQPPTWTVALAADFRNKTSVQTSGKLETRPAAWTATWDALTVTLPNGQVWKNEQPGRFVKNDEGELSLEGFKLSSKKGKGQIMLMGKSRLPDLNFHLTASKLNVNEKNTFDATGDADIQIGGTTEGPHITGHVQLSQAVVQGFGNDKKKDKKKTPEKSPSAASTSPPVWVRTAMNIQAVWPNRVWYRDGGTAIETDGDLRITKMAGDPHIYLEGTIDSLQGSADYYGRRFDIESGEIRFMGPPHSDPVFTARASYQGGSTTVYLDVTGPLENLNVKLTSNPPLSEQDVLSVLVFGEPVNELQTNGASNQARLSEAAGSALGSYLTRELRSSGISYLDFDVMELQQAPENQGTQMTVGRYIGPRFFVSYGQVFGSEARAVTGEYYLSDHWTVQGQSGTEEDNHLDLVFRYPLNAQKGMGPKRVTGYTLPTSPIDQRFQQLGITQPLP